MKSRNILILMLLTALSLSDRVYAQLTPPPVIMLTSYSIKGNMATDKTIVLELILANTSRVLDANDILLSYTSGNDTFLPAGGISNQFFIPVIPAGGSVTYAMELAVNNAQPNNSLYLDFNVVFSDRINGTNTNQFLISESVKNSNAIQLLGMEIISINKLEDSRSIAVLKATVINHSNFPARDVTMILKGQNPDFTVSIPLGDISPDQHLSNEFNLTLASDRLPRFNVVYNYTDTNDVKQVSDPQHITVYSNDSLDVETQVQFIFRMVAAVLLIIFVTAGLVVFINNYLNRKKRF